MINNYPDYLLPVSSFLTDRNRLLPLNSLGRKLKIYSNEFPDLSSVHIAIIGIAQNDPNKQGLNAIREQFYRLYNPEYDVNIADLGDFRQAKNKVEQHKCISEIIASLMSKGIVTILVGDAHNLTLGQYYAYRLLNIKPSVTIIDRQVAFSEEGQYNFLQQVTGSKKEVLQSFSLIGYQGCFTDPDLIKKLDSPKYSFYRLGKFKNNIQEAEPIIREAHMLSFDMEAIRIADAPATAAASPNGFYAEDACQLAKYAGMNDKLTTFGLYGFDMTKDKQAQTAQLMAQMIWYFTDGFYNRKNDIPKKNNQNFYTYKLEMRDKMGTIVFWKSKLSGRWWAEFPVSNKKEKSTVLQDLYPCSHEDYKNACDGEIPQRWLKLFN